jgi:hypothetical protein
MPQEVQTSQKMQMSQEAGTQEVSLEVSRNVSLQMSSRFPRQEVPQELTYYLPPNQTYY